MFGRATITLGIDAHSSFFIVHLFICLITYLTTCLLTYLLITNTLINFNKYLNKCCILQCISVFVCCFRLFTHHVFTQHTNINSPVQLNPSPVNPVRQLQLNPPWKFVQLANSLQPPLFTAHSSTSGVPVRKV